MRTPFRFSASPPVVLACAAVAARTLFVLRRTDLVRSVGDTLLGTVRGLLTDLAVLAIAALVAVVLVRLGLRRIAAGLTALVAFGWMALSGIESEYFAFSRNRFDPTFLAYLGEWRMLAGSAANEISPTLLALHAGLGFVFAALAWRDRDSKPPRIAPLAVTLIVLGVVEGYGVPERTLPGRQWRSWHGAMCARSMPDELLRALRPTRREVVTDSATEAALETLRSFTNPFGTKRFFDGSAPLAHLGGRAPAGAFGPVRAPLNVLFVMAEGLEAGVMAAAGGTDGLTPALDRLAREGLFFRRFFANGAHTPRALEASLCGLVPRPSGAPLSRAQPDMPTMCLSEILRRAGYQTAFVHGGFEQFENRFEFLGRIGFQRTLFFEQFGRHLPVTNKWGTTDARTYDEALAWLARRDPARPFFLDVLSISNHHPFHVPDPALELDREPGRLHRNTLRYADRELGRFIEALRERGLLETTLVFVFGDHGLTRDNVRAGHALGLLLQRANVPLIVLGPKALLPAPRLVDRIASQQDLLPTVLDALGLDVPHHATGHSLGWTWAADRDLPATVHDLYSGLFATFDADGVTIVSVDDPHAAPLAGRWHDEPTRRPLAEDTLPDPAHVARARAIVRAVQHLYAAERWWRPGLRVDPSVGAAH